MGEAKVDGISKHYPLDGRYNDGNRDGHLCWNQFLPLSLAAHPYFRSCAFSARELDLRISIPRSSLANHERLVTEIAHATSAGYAKISERIAHSSQTSAQVLEAASTWQRALDERDSEIVGLRPGMI